MKLIEEEKSDLKHQFSTARLIENRVRGRRHCEREKVQILKAANLNGKIAKKWLSYRECHLYNLQIQEGATTFAKQTLNLVDQL